MAGRKRFVTTETPFVLICAGNIASLNSFDPQSILCLTGVTPNVYLMAFILVSKASQHSLRN